MPARAAAAAISARELALIVLLAAPLGVVLTVIAPIPQDLAYHDFADRRTFLSVPNFADVVSNLPFLVVGWMGLRLCLRGGTNGATLPAYLMLRKRLPASACPPQQTDIGGLPW